MMHRKVNNTANSISARTDRNKSEITLYNHSHCRRCSSTGSVKTSNSPATQLSDTVNWARDVRLMCRKTNIKVLRIPRANIYMRIKAAQDIPNGVDVCFEAPCKFQPSKMAKGVLLCIFWFIYLFFPEITPHLPLGVHEITWQTDGKRNLNGRRAHVMGSR